MYLYDKVLVRKEKSFRPSMTMVGTDGVDVFVGGLADDTFYGGGGDDWFDGGAAALVCTLPFPVRSAVSCSAHAHVRAGVCAAGSKEHVAK